MQEEVRRLAIWMRGGGEVNVSFARTVTIRGRGRQMGQLAEERRHIGGESCG